MNSKPIKIYLLSGFLGAGKTTLLRRLIDQLAGNRIGVIMNEFGQIGIDGPRISQNGLEVLEINNGSIFCSCLQEAFIDGLIAYSGLPIDYLLVESSGMADPSTIRNILDSLVGKVGRRKYEYQGAICIVDGRHFLKQVELLPAIEKQVVVADVIVLNKIDLVDKATVDEVEGRIKGLNPGARLTKTSYCILPAELLAPASELVEIKDAVAESCNTPFNRPVAVTLTAPGIFERDKLVNFLRTLPPVAFRAKGYFRTPEEWLQVDVVGEQIELQPAGKAYDASRLLVIAERPDGQELARAIRAGWADNFAAPITLASE